MHGVSAILPVLCLCSQAMVSLGGDPPVTVTESETLKCIRFSPDGKWLALGGGKSEHGKLNGSTIWWEAGFVKWWDVENKKLLPRVVALDGYPRTLDVSPDGKLLAAGIGSSPKGSVFVIDAGTGKVKTRLVEQTDEPGYLRFSPDGKTLAALNWSGREIKIWGTSDWRRISALAIAAFAPRPHTISFTPDSKSLLADSPFVGMVTINVKTEKTDVKKIEDRHGRVAIVCEFSPDGKLCALGHGKPIDGKDFKDYEEYWTELQTAGEVHLWNTETGRDHRWLKGHKKSVWRLSFSANGERIASGSRDGNVKVWDVATGREIVSVFVDGESIWMLALSPDGKTLAAQGVTGALRIWKIK